MEPDGQPGEAWLERADCNCKNLAGIDQAEVEPGDMLVVRTPGGGGYGSAGKSTKQRMG